MEDNFHMTEQVQKRVHEALWQHVGNEERNEGGPSAPIPIVALDFNAGTGFMNKHYQRYLDFFKSLCTFRKGDPSQTWSRREDRLKARDQLVRAVGEAYPTWECFTVRDRRKIANDPECFLTPWNPSEWGTSLRCQGFFYDPELLGRCIN